jgi:hypothetical protein
MLYRNAYCEHCNQETTYSSIWSGDPFKCRKCGNIKIVSPQTYSCKNCTKLCEYDAATCTFSEKQSDGTYILTTYPESEYCIDCDNELDT